MLNSPFSIISAKIIPLLVALTMIIQSNWGENVSIHAFDLSALGMTLYTHLCEALSILSMNDIECENVSVQDKYYCSFWQSPQPELFRE